MILILHEWLKDLAPIVVSIAVLFATWSFYKWQIRLGKQKLRHELYERRIAIYLAFQELLVGLPEQNDDEIKALFRRANIARLEVPFLFDSPKLEAYLGQLCKQISEDIIGNMMFRESIKDQAVLMTQSEIVQDFTQRVSRLGAAKLDIPGHHLTKLAREFTGFLKLTDFWKS